MEKHIIALLEAQTFDGGLDIGCYLIRDDIEKPLEALRSAAIEDAKTHAEWTLTSTSGGYTWGDFLLMSDDSILERHGIVHGEKLMHGNGVEHTITGLRKLYVDEDDVLYQEDTVPGPDTPVLGKDAPCGIVAAVLTWQDGTRTGTATQFLLAELEAIGNIEELLRESAMEYIYALGGWNGWEAMLNATGASRYVCWGDVFEQVPDDFLLLNGVRKIHGDTLLTLNPQLVKIETIVLDNDEEAVGDLDFEAFCKERGAREDI